MSSAPTQAPIVAPPGRRPPGPGATPQGQVGAMISLDPMKLLQQYYRWLVASAVAGVVIGFISYFALVYTYPRFDAVVDYQVYPEPESASDTGNRSGNRGGGQEEMETYMQTQVLVMASDQILKKVIEERPFRETKWAGDYKKSDGQIEPTDALIELKKIVRARVIPDTSVIRLVVRTADKFDATTMANTISVVFLDFVRQISTKDLRDLMQQFEAQARDLGQEIASIDVRIETLLSRSQMTSLRAENSVAANEVRTLQPALVDLRGQLTQAKQQLDLYTSMLASPGGVVYPDRMRSDVENGPLIARQVSLIAEQKASYSALRKERGDQDRAVIRLKNTIESLEEQLEETRRTQLADMFSAQVESLTNSVQGMQASESQLMDLIQKATIRLSEVAAQEKQVEDMRSDRQQKLLLKKESEQQVNNLRTLLNRPIRVRELSRAAPPDELAFPRLIPTVLICSLLIPAAMGGLIALREIREQRVRGPQDIALIPRMRVLGVMPDLAMDPTNPEKIEGICVDRPAGVIAEAVRQLRTTLLKELESRGHRVVLFVGGLPGAGVTSMVTNLASNAAAMDLRVLVIDANLRRPRVHTLLGTSDHPGLSEALMGSCTVAQAIVATKQANLFVLPAGKREGQVFERFITASMAQIIEEARKGYDLVLIDAPPAVVASDALAIAGHTDATVLIVRAFSEKRGLVARLRNQFGETRSEFLGVVINAVQASAGGYLRRNIQAQHEYGREASDERILADRPHDPATNGTIKSIS